VIHGFDVRPGASAPTIEISSRLFHQFRPYSGPVPAGFWVDWLGVMTRADVWPFAPEVKATYTRDRKEETVYPIHDEHVLDWVPLLEAVTSSGPVFRMAALGAGWGRWLCSRHEAHQVDAA
jgi:hypothetical protein